MKQKRVLFLGPSRSIHILKWIDYFREEGYYCGLATFGRSSKIEVDELFLLSERGTNVIGGNYHYLFSIPRLIHIINDFEPTFLIAHFSYSMGFISTLALKFVNHRPHFSVVCHGSDILDPPFPSVSKYINYWVARSADTIFSVSNQIKNVIKGMGINEEKICYGFYGLDERVFLPRKSKDIDLLSFRSYVPNSRIDWLLNQIKDMGNTGLRICFVLPDATEEDLRSLSLKYPFIDFLPALGHSELIELMARSKIYLSATLSDGTSLSLLEAMSNGCFPVVSSIPANREWIDDRINGRLFNDPSEFRSALLDTLSLGNDVLNQIREYNIRMLSERALYKNRMRQIVKRIESEVN